MILEYLDLVFFINLTIELISLYLLKFGCRQFRKLFFFIKKVNFIGNLDICLSLICNQNSI